MRYFEDFNIGETKLFNDTYHVTEEEIMEFGNRWDPQPFHIDKEAAKDSIFKGLVASSGHIIVASMRVAMMEEPAAAVSALGFDRMKMLVPVRPDDVLRKKETILETRLSNSRPGCGIVRALAEIINQKDELVCSFEAAFLVRCKEE